MFDRVSIQDTTIGSMVSRGRRDETAHLPIHTDRFQHIITRFQATGFGYAAVNRFTYQHIGDTGRRSLPTKTV